MNTPISDLITDGMPYCSSAFPLCGLLLGVLPPPEGLSSNAAAALTCVFCLMAVIFVNIVYKSTYGEDSDSYRFFYVILGGAISITILVYLTDTLSLTPFVLTTTSSFIGFFVGLSWIFAWLKNLALPLKNKDVP